MRTYLFFQLLILLSIDQAFQNNSAHISNSRVAQCIIGKLLHLAVLLFVIPDENAHMLQRRVEILTLLSLPTNRWF